MAEAAVKQEQKDQEEPKRKYFRVIIHGQENHEGGNDVIISVNGKANQYKRDVEVLMESSYFKVLKDSSYTTYSKNDKGDDIVREVPRFSYSVLGVVEK